MTKLNLAMLDELERDVQETVKAHVAGDSDATLRLDRVRVPFDVECLAQLRPLLDLTEKMARALRGAGRDACLRFNDCPHDCCIWRRSVLEEYRRAGGKLR